MWKFCTRYNDEIFALCEIADSFIFFTMGFAAQNKFILKKEKGALKYAFIVYKKYIYVVAQMVL